MVNRENAKYPLDVYRFLTRELGVRRVQFISCVEPKVFRDVAPQHWDPALLPVVGTPQAKPGAPDSVVTDWSVDPDDWGAFLCKVWDDWYARDYGKVHVDLFETAVAQSMGMPSQRCVTAEFCGKGMAVEHNGDVFSCDHYVYPEYRVGNIGETHWAAMAYSERAEEIRLRQARHAARLLPAMPAPEAVLGRMPEEPAGAHAVGRSRAELSVPRPEEILRAHPARHAADQASRGKAARRAFVQIKRGRIR